MVRLTGMVGGWFEVLRRWVWRLGLSFEWGWVLGPCRMVGLGFLIYFLGRMDLWLGAQI
jgi:hypothetical protein